MRKLLPALFVLMLVVGCASGVSDHNVPPTSGIHGTVLLGPMCPVERVESPCPDKPIEAVVEATNGSGTIVATVRSDGNGRFTMYLAPGTYSLDVTGLRAMESSKPVTVSVPQDGFVTVEVMVDSGIR